MELAWNKRHIHFNCVAGDPGPVAAAVVVTSWLSAATCLLCWENNEELPLQNVLSNVKRSQ